MRKFPYLGFIVFLVSYSYVKYTAVPQLMGQTQYMITTAVLVVLTAVIPFYISYLAVRNNRSNTRYTIALVLPLVLSAIGLAVYFFLFIAPNAPDMSVVQVLPRAVVPGLVMSALLLIPMIVHRN